MTKKNYAAMSDQELKRYFLTHRDNEAFYAYIDRRHSRSRGAIVEFDDPAWEEKIIAVIQAQLEKDSTK